MTTKVPVPESLVVIIESVIAEYERATAKHGPFHSRHEGFAVLLEEVDELWDSIKRNEGANHCREAVQVAAMSLRYLHDCI